MPAVGNPPWDKLSFDRKEVIGSLFLPVLQTTRMEEWVGLGVCPSIAFCRCDSKNAVARGPEVPGAARSRHEQDLSRLVPRPGLPLPALAPGLAPRGRPGLLPPRHRRHPRPLPLLRPLRARTPRPAAVPSPDDGRPAAVLLRHRHPLLAQDHEALPAPTSPAGSSSATTSPTSAPSATSARPTWPAWRPSSSRCSSSAPWPGWPRSGPSPWTGPRSRPTPRGTRR